MTIAIPLGIALDHVASDNNPIKDRFLIWSSSNSLEIAGYQHESIQYWFYEDPLFK